MSTLKVTNIQHPDADSVGITLASDGSINILVTAQEKTASYTLVLTDAFKAIEMNVASANNLTVPPNSDVAFAVGTQIIVIQTGAGETTLVQGSGVTINSAGDNKKLGDRWAGVTLVKRATDTWVAVGNLKS